MVATDAIAGWERTTLMTTNVTSADGFGSVSVHSESVIIPMSIFLIIVMILAIAGNSMVILTIMRHKGMRTRTNMFITNLAISDILATLSDMPVSLVTLIEGEWIFGNSFCLFNGFTNALFLLTSIHTLMFISIHKYMSITRPFSRFMTPKRILAMIISTWVWSGAYAAAGALGWNPSVIKTGATQCGPSDPGDDVAKQTHSLVNTVCNYVVPLLVMTFCYVRIFCEIRHHMQRMRDNTNMDLRNSLLQQKRITVTLFMVLACFLFCITPYIVYSCSVAFGKDKERVPLIPNPVAYWFVYANSACNPIIYAFRSPSFRQGYKEIMCGRSSAYIMGESIPNDSGRLSLRNIRNIPGTRRSSEPVWRKMSLMASWRGYQKKRRAQSLDSARPINRGLSPATVNSHPPDSPHPKQSNGVSQHQYFNTIAEASVEEEPSSSAHPETVLPPVTLVQTTSTEEKKDDVVDESLPDCSQATPTKEDTAMSTNKDQDKAIRPAHEHTFSSNEKDDEFYDSDVEQEDKAEERSTITRLTRLQSRSCIFHVKDSLPNQSPTLQNEESHSIKRHRPCSWSQTDTQSKSNNKIAKKPLPTPFLWQPSVAHLDVPRRVMRNHERQPDSNTTETSRKEDSLTMTKRITSSFRTLFRKSHEKNLDCQKRKKAFSESMV